MIDHEKELEKVKQLCAYGSKWPYVCESKTKQFLRNLGESGKIADEVSDLILFHTRVRKHAEKRHM